MNGRAIHLPPDLLAEVEAAAHAAGLAGADEFVELAVSEKLRAFREAAVLRITDRVRQGLSERGMSEDEVIEDFERFRTSDDHR